MTHNSADILMHSKLNCMQDTYMWMLLDIWVCQGRNYPSDYGVKPSYVYVYSIRISVRLRVCNHDVICQTKNLLCKLSLLGCQNCYLFNLYPDNSMRKSRNEKSLIKPHLSCCSLMCVRCLSLTLSFWIRVTKQQSM